MWSSYKFWKWPDRKDETFYDHDNVLEKFDSGKIVQMSRTRAIFDVIIPMLKSHWGEN